MPGSRRSSFGSPAAALAPASTAAIMPRASMLTRTSRSQPLAVRACFAKMDCGLSHCMWGSRPYDAVINLESILKMKSQDNQKLGKWDTLWVNAHLATMCGADGYGIIKD